MEAPENSNKDVLPNAQMQQEVGININSGNSVNGENIINNADGVGSAGSINSGGNGINGINESKANGVNSSNGNSTKWSISSPKPNTINSTQKTKKVENSGPQGSVNGNGANGKSGAPTPKKLPSYDNKGNTKPLTSYFYENGKVHKRNVAILSGLIISALFFIMLQGGNEESKPEPSVKSQPAPSEPLHLPNYVPEIQKDGRVETQVPNNGLDNAAKTSVPDSNLDKNKPAVDNTAQNQTALDKSKQETKPEVKPDRQQEVPKPETLKKELDPKFSFSLRAGRKADLQEERALANSLASQNNAAVEATLANRINAATLQGAHISMILDEPVTSGIPSSVSATVISDVLDNRDNVLIPYGSTALIPFSNLEVRGRLINDTNSPITLILTDGSKLLVNGVVKGNDGLAGLAGKVKKVNGTKSLLSGIGKQAGLIGAVGVQAGVGGVGGGILGATAADVTNKTIPNVNTQRVVEVAKDVSFILTVN